MGIDYDGVGGIGIKVTDEIVETLIENKAFTEEEWEEDPYECCEDLDVEYAIAGNLMHDSGDMYLLVEGNTLDDINLNKDKFIEALDKVGVKITSKDLLVISEMCVS